jgi:hypothetical protein
MILRPTNPIIIEGETYDRYTAGLAINTEYLGDYLDAQVSMRLIPTRIDENNEAVMAEDYMIPLTLATTEGVSGAEEAAMLGIFNSVQTYILSKGI